MVQRIWILFKNSKTKTSKTKTHKNIEQRSNLKDPISSQRNKRDVVLVFKVLVFKVLVFEFLNKIHILCPGTVFSTYLLFHEAPLLTFVSLR